MSGCSADSHSLSVKRADSRTGGAFSSRSSVNQVFLRTGARNANVQPLRGRAEAHKRKKHSDLLCFLVAGRRIELRTS